MSELDIQRLDARFQAWKKDRLESKASGEAFEYYSVYQILKTYDLDDDELESGNIGGSDDEGADGIYLFINDILMTEETELPKYPEDAHLIIVQAKYSDNYKEFVITKLEALSRIIFDFTKEDSDIDSIPYLNSKAKDAIKNFRSKLHAIIKFPFIFKVSFYYVTKSQNVPNPKMLSRAELINQYIRAQFTNADVTFSFWGCREMLSSTDKIPSGIATIKVTEKFYTTKKHSVCLARMNDFVELLTDEDGNIKTRLLEANVRDFQGSDKEVNNDIRSTICSGDVATDFWWLNNGVTILASDCTLKGDTLEIAEPKIVNGLQTSHIIFDEYRDKKRPGDSRQILIKVIVSKDEKTSTEIIKATNNQTTVQKISLKAMERVHFDIENKLKIIGLFYDRRKGKYKQQNKPISQIVSMLSMGQAVMSILLQRPDDARARPATALGRLPDYNKIFNENYDLNVYANCIRLDRHVEDFLDQLVRARAIKADTRRDLKFYENMIVACELCKKLHPTALDLATLSSVCASAIDYSILQASHDMALAAYNKFGGDDKAAKGFDLKVALLMEIEQKYPEPPHVGPNEPVLPPPRH